MKPVEKVVAPVILIAYLVLAWSMGPLLALKGPSLWVLRIGLILLGIIAFIGFWILRSRQGAGAGELIGSKPGSESENQIDNALREARERLAAADKSWAGSITSMPVVLVLGASGSAKTTAIAQSGLEPELVSGQAYRDGAIVPTAALNLWVGGQTLFADVAGKFLQDADAKKRLIGRLRPPSVSAMLGRGTQPPRAVIVCVDGEVFLESKADAAAAQAQEIRDALREIARDWGVHLPVYVMVTKMDRIAHFTEFAAKLSNEEVAGILGSTRPGRTEWSDASYAQEESRALTLAFDEIYYSLAAFRPELLAREYDDAGLGSAYQFPRDFRKMRDRLVRFLVEICRPSQLAANPYLRGFYFTGVRPIVVAGPAPDAARPRQKAALLADATGIFEQAAARNPEPMAGERTGRRVPQWVFLSRWFRDVLLQDGVARTLSGSSVSTDLWRQALLGLAAFVFLILGIGWIVSNSVNRELKEEFLSARQSLTTAGRPSYESLEKLEALRVLYAKLEDNEKYGAPMSARWGLYVGGDLRPAASKTYFEHFRKLLLQPAQTSLLGVIAAPAMGPRPVYDALKGYLITTSNPDKSNVDFLAPLLTDHWSRGIPMDQRTVDLARRQFAFYAGMLPTHNPYPAAPNAAAVDAARQYLGKFSASESLYQAMLAKASEQFPSIRFNQQFPGSAEVVRNNYPVPGAFTKGGWTFMTDAIENPDRYFSGERWVMGDQAFAGLDRAKLKTELQTRYQADFARTWREFLRATSVNPYLSVADGATKLTALSGNQSPLLLVLCVASQNTSSAAPDVAKIFQSTQLVTPAGCQEQLSSPGNKPYVDKLIDLQAKLQQVAANLASDPAKAEASSAATNALVGARQTAQGFRIDPEGQIQNVVQKLLEAPIDYSQRVITGAAAGPVNEAGKDTCNQFKALMAKFPFNPKSTDQATVANVNAVFQPGQGALWKLYGEHLAKLMPQQGSDFGSTPAGGISVTRPFLGFFRNAAGISNTFFKGGAAQPQLAFTLKPQRTEGIEKMMLSINGQTMSGAGGETWQFQWPGAGPQEVKLTVKIAGGSELAYPSYTGLWAVWEFFSRAKWEQSGSDSSLEWTLGTAGGAVTLPGSGKPVTVRFDLSMAGAPPVLKPGWFATLSCPLPAAE
jgi:type VI secretion system protein ImpL